MSGSEPKRCAWALGVNQRYIDYHDTEWGVPARDDRRQFEFLILEGAQAGLSWAVVLNKRDGYRKAFSGFDPQKVARYNARSVARLVNDASIIRNKQKINAAINNAQRFLKVQHEFGTFSDYIWGFVDGKPVVNHWKTEKQIPATSEMSDALSKDLKQRGFKFVGSTIMYSHMQATGMINDHVISCFRYKACLERQS